MIIIKLKGGIGNQMFQYCFGRALALRRKEDLFLDTSNFGNESKKDTPREYALDHFNIKATIASREITRRYNPPIIQFFRKLYRKIVSINHYGFNKRLSKSQSSYFEGYWQNEMYFKDCSDQIRLDLSLSQMSLDSLSPATARIANELDANKANGKICVSLHVRRGDYISNPNTSNAHNTLGLEYYDQALSHLSSKLNKNNMKIYVYSDDIEWVKNNFKLGEYSFEYVSSPDFESIYLMSKCQHHIIANSSFSWWGAWLNPNPQKIVIAPKKWLKNSSIDTNGVCPPEWIRI